MLEISLKGTNPSDLPPTSTRTPSRSTLTTFPVMISPCSNLYAKVSLSRRSNSDLEFSSIFCSDTEASSPLTTRDCDIGLLYPLYPALTLGLDLSPFGAHKGYRCPG